MKKKMSDIVLHRVRPPDSKEELTIDDLSRVLVKRLGLVRKKSRADHPKLLRELIKYRKDNVPITIEKISEILGVSESQTYEELRKWRTMGLIEFVKVPSGDDFIKGYMLTGNTANRLLDRVEASLKSFMRQTRRIAKDFDDSLMLEIARASRTEETTQDVQNEDYDEEEN